MRIIFVNRFFWPDHSATAQILGDLTFELATRGFDVEVVTSRLSYSDRAERFPRLEECNGVLVRRVFTTGLGRSSILGRMFDFISFYLSCAFTISRILKRGDILIVKTDPPLLTVLLAPIAMLYGARQVNWIQDIYPELAAALGVKLASGVFGKILRSMRDWSLRSAAVNVVLGERMRDRLTVRGLLQESVVIIPNFTDDHAVQPIPSSRNALRSEWGFCLDDLVVGYSGNLGLAHDLHTTMRAAKLLQDMGQNKVRFLFIGGGALFDTIQNAVSELGLSNVSVRPYQPREMLSESLAVPDIHLISLRNELEGYILPSKYYGILACGRAVVFLGSPNSDISVEIEAEGLGATFEIGEGRALAAYLAASQRDRLLVDKSGRSARALMDKRYRRSLIFDCWERLLRGLGG